MQLCDIILTNKKYYHESHRISRVWKRRSFANRSPHFTSPSHYPADDEIALFGSTIRRTVVANAGYDKTPAEAELEKGIARLISFGTLFLANPVLPKRFEKDATLNKPDRATMFGGGAQGYIDYGFLND